jgi:hypothetical protein
VNSSLARISIIIVLAAILVGAGLLAVIRALSASGAGGSATQASPQTVLISVPARRAWTDTGIDLTAGSKVSIVAGGIIYISRNDPGMEPSGPPVFCKQPIRSQAHASDASFTAPGLPCWSLIGRKGAGAPFAVGDAKGFSTRTGGRLYLGVNDQIRAFGDNSGSWTATVSVSRG